MKINCINKTGFKGVTRIDSLSNPKHTPAYFNKNEIDNPTKNVIRLLNNQETGMYTKEEAEVIKMLHMSHIKDYDGKNAIVRRINGKIYLITGDDIKKVLDAEKMTSPRKVVIQEDETSEKGIKCMYIIDSKSIIDSYILNRAGQDALSVEYTSTDVDKTDLTREEILGIEPIDIKLNYFQFSHFKRV